jgi:hypothetical protein
VTVEGFLNSVVGGASVLGAILAVAGLWSAKHTNRLISEGQKSHEATLARMDESTKQILTQMETNAVRRHGDAMDAIERRR